ncbi:MAG: GNAT family N-acetyltransferase [Chlamydiia bacterium]|nr:GNAT family N-acetyltransferase [Chlamydiia bacterium]
MISTKRLILRPWKEGDKLSYAQMNADPKVMEFFPGLMTKEESNAQAERIQLGIEERGWGFFAAELKETGEFIGIIGINPVDFLDRPTTEIGWRLASEHWGMGYAPEGAKACLDYAFKTLKLPEIVAFTAKNNQKSRRVMEKIRLKHVPERDFKHPQLAPNHPLSQHVLYAISREDYFE